MKDRRFAIKVEMSDGVKNGIIIKGDLNLFFEKFMSIGQVIDNICKTTGVKQVIDYD